MSEHDSFFDQLEQAMNTDLAKEGSAARPSPDLWQQIRADYDRQSMKRESTMSTATPTPTFDQVVPVSMPSSGRSLGQYLNTATSFALVLAVAIGGWFATMQLNSPNGSNDAFGLIGQSDGEATCDVEPMTVDEVMAIVENPYRYADPDVFQTSRYGTRDYTPWLDDFAEVQPNGSPTLVLGAGDVPTQAAFDQSSEVISQYIACLQQDPTVAMMLRFSDPFSIQHHVRNEFPFYRTEDVVREYVQGWLTQSDGYHTFTGLENNEGYTYGQVDDRHYATTQIHDFGLGFDQIIYVGTEVYDENGEFQGVFMPVLNLTYGRDGKYSDRGVIFTLIHSRYTGEWYVVTEGWVFTGGI